MKQSLLSPALLASNVKRFWPLWLAFAAAWLVCLVLPMALIAPMVSNVMNAFSSPMGEIWIVLQAASVCGIALASFLSAVLVFEYLFSQPSALFHGALPLKRTPLFASVYLAGLLPLLVIEVVVGLLLFALSLSFACIAVQDVLNWLALSIASTFVLYSMAVLCGQLSGTRSMAAVLFVAGNCLIIVLEGMFRVLAWSMLWGMNLDGELATVWTSPVAGIIKYVIAPEATGSSLDTLSWLALGAYCIVAVVFVAIAALLNKRRNLEVAGSTAAYKAVRVASKYADGITLAVAFGFVALFCVSISNGEQGLTLGQQIIVALMMAVGGFIGIFFGEAYIQRSTRVFRETWKPGLALAVLSVVFVAGCAFDVAGVQGHVPQNSDVASVEVRCQSSASAFTSESGIDGVTRLHRMILDEGKPQGSEGIQEDVDFAYHLKDGRTVMRSYSVAVGHEGKTTQIEKQISDLMNSDEAVLYRYHHFLDAAKGAVEVEVELEHQTSNGTDVSEHGFVSASKVDEFLNGALKKDLLENGAGDLHLNGVEYESLGYISLSYRGQTADGVLESDATTITLTKEYTPNSLAWITGNVALERSKS